MRRQLAFILVLAVAGGGHALAQVEPVPAGTTHASPLNGSSASVTGASDPLIVEEAPASILRLIAGRSTIVNVGAPIARVSLTSADVADALVTGPEQLLVHGKVPGSVSLFVWNRAGGIQRYEVAVQRDLDRLTEQMTALLPGEPVSVHGNGRFVMLSGMVSEEGIAQKAVNLATGFVDEAEEVVSLLQVQEPAPADQVILRVRFAEVSRSALTELGLSLFTSPTGVRNTVGRVTTQQFSAPGFSGLEWTKESSDFGARVTSAEGQFTFSDFLNFFVLSERFDLGLAIRALQSEGLFQSLAEPNLVAQSGSEASFLAGGEFPIPVAQGSGENLAISVVFKEFGIRLNFTPTVLGDRVQLKVRPEVSALDFGNAVVLNGFRIPALTTRRTETELELRDGQTFAIAGLLDNSMNSTLQKIPGIGDIPIIGRLFQSKAAQKHQTELVVMITPEIVRGNSPGVTAALPRQPEPYLPPVLPAESTPPPPPAFSTAPGQ